MAEYRFAWDYTSGVGIYATGDVADLDDETAAYIGRDSPGVLEVLVPADTDEGRSVPAPPSDRRQRRRKDRQGDPGDQGAMTGADHAALRRGGA